MAEGRDEDAQHAEFEARKRQRAWLRRDKVKEIRAICNLRAVSACAVGVQAESHKMDGLGA